MDMEISDKSGYRYKYTTGTCSSKMRTARMIRSDQRRNERSKFTQRERYGWGVRFKPRFLTDLRLLLYLPAMLDAYTTQFIESEILRHTVYSVYR